MRWAKKAEPVDPEFAEIDEFEHLLVLGRRQILEVNQIPPDQIERELVDVARLAKAVTDRLREEHTARVAGRLRAETEYSDRQRAQQEASRGTRE